MAIQTRVATLQLGERKATADGLKTFPATLSTDVPVPRRTWQGDYNEILRHTPEAIDLSRAPLPLIEVHDRQKVNIGIVNGLRIADGRLRGDLVLGKSARAQELADDIAAGIVSGISIGYVIDTVEISQDGALQTATRWTPFEVSIVPVPADIAAGIGRSATPNPMNRSGNVEPKTQGSEDVEAIKNRELERVSGIRHAVKTARLETSIAQNLIDSGASLEKARGVVLDLLAARDAEVKTEQHVPITGGRTEGEAFVEGASAALLERMNPSLFAEASKRNLDGFDAGALKGNPMRGLGLFDLARLSLERHGDRLLGMSRMQIVGRAFTAFRGGPYAGTSDFGILLENLMHKILLASYAVTPDVWQRCCKIEIVSDFRDAPRYRTGALTVLDSKLENGEFKNKALPDGEKTVINTATKGNIIAISREAIVNDDMNALGDLATKLGRAAKLTIESDFMALLALNGGLGPSITIKKPSGDVTAAFFNDAAWANISTGAAIGVDALEADRVKMAAQKDPSGVEYLDLKPAVLLVPSGLGGKARVLNNAQYDVTSGSANLMPNKVVGLFRDVVDTPRLSGTRRYLFADPGIAAAFVVVMLEGQGQGPVIETELGWRVDGTEMRVRQDAKVMAFDPRAAVSNAGA